ncbi:MAG: helix-turn-helix transcriptional regulator [Paracoccaceae bacterium]|nr:helix-turn-helix transcriptional regulator [Paracoccaceae bacterium]
MESDIPVKVAIQEYYMSHPVDIHVGQQLKRMRILRNLTQTDVAQGLKISFQQVQKYELGRNRISASRLFELSHILNVPPAFFFEGLENSPNESERALDDEATKIASMFTRIEDARLRTQIRTFINELASTAPKIV